MPIRTMPLIDLLRERIPSNLIFEGDVMEADIEVTETMDYPYNKKPAKCRIVIDAWVNPPSK